MDAKDRDGFWNVVAALRRSGKIPQQWGRADIRPHLRKAGYADTAITTIPSNASMTRDGREKGDYVKKGRPAVAYRVGRGLFELIADPVGEDPQTTYPPKVESRERSKTSAAPGSGLDSDRAAIRLSTIVRRIALEKRDELNAGKRTNHWNQDDFIWEALLVSMATMGNSRGVALVHKPELHEQVQWGVLEPFKNSECQKRLERTLRAAKVRMPQKKAQWLAANLQRIKESGGPLGVKRALERCVGREAKIRFLQAFEGVGPKYARNMLMDVYHSDFHESIAIDDRIKKVLRSIGVRSTDYAKTEAFLLRVAYHAGLNGWELDRVLYNYTGAVLKELSGTRTS
jgi:hypothetical protein